jgi:predicted acylesterase/phospholipase RssA
MGLEVETELRGRADPPIHTRGRPMHAPRPAGAGTAAPETRADPQPTAATAPPELECDLVMKGGVTSGVIYPLAICRLADRYRLRSIGGASAGAIAAAAAAAAEYARQTGAKGDRVGFAGLCRLPNDISEVGDDGRSRLLSLFQPAPATETLFEAFLLAITKEPVHRRVGKVLRLVVKRHQLFPRLALLLAAIATGWTATSAGPLAAVLVALTGLCTIAVGVALAAVAAVRTGLAGLAANGAGMCSGFRSDQSPEAEANAEANAGNEQTAATPPLCEWLADLFDELAGKPPGGAPLTFGELREKKIDLAMITTNLTHGRPYRLPLEGGAFFFRKSEFRRLFPARVVDAMTNAAGRRVRALESRRRSLAFTLEDDRVLKVHHVNQVELGDDFCPFPDPDDLPVVVATRLSLSFPILLSAVPLYAVDWTRKPGPNGKWILERCWFSDGGICSNLPIHFFDTLLPTRPTFALNLEAPHPDWPVHLPPFEPGRSELDNVWMPGQNHDGSAEQWSRIGIDDAGLTPTELLAAMVDTMQSWSDNMQSKAPGYRERVVHIPHLKEEGGLNLTMPADVIKRLSARGEAAGQLAVDTFAPPPGSGKPDGFRDHLWVRYRSAVAMLQDLLGRSYAGYFVDNGPRKILDDLILSCKGELTEQQLALVQHVNAEFARLGEELRNGGISLASIAPLPQPELRARPRGA